MKRIKLYENWIQELDKNGSNFLKKWVDLNKILTDFIEERKHLLEEDLVFINDLLPNGNELSIDVSYNDYKFQITQPQFDVSSIGREVEVDVETMKDILDEIISYIRKWNNEYYIAYRIMFEDKRHHGPCWDISDTDMIEEIDWEDVETIIINRIEITLW